MLQDVVRLQCIGGLKRKQMGQGYRDSTGFVPMLSPMGATNCWHFPRALRAHPTAKSFFATRLARNIQFKQTEKREVIPPEWLTVKDELTKREEGNHNDNHQGAETVYAPHVQDVGLNIREIESIRQAEHRRGCG